MTKELFERFQKAVAGLVEQGDVTPAPVEAEDMTVEQFVGYATEEIEKSQKDAAEIRLARLRHLAKNVEDVQKEIVGPTPQPGGLFKVNRFQDPGQVKTTETTKAPTSTLPQVTNFAENIPPAQAGVGNTPPGGQLPPIGAGSGAGGGAAVSFAKALEDLEKAIDELTPDKGGNPPKDGETQVAKGDEGDKGDKGKPPTKDGDKPPAKVEKSDAIYWPNDMATPHGMGETKDPEAPPWGRDGKDIPEDAPPKADAAE